MAATLLVEITVDRDATDAERQALRSTCEAFGLKVADEFEYFRKSLGDLPWMVILALPVMPFFTTFSTELAKDAYGGLKAFIKSVRAARTEHSGSRGSIFLVDAETRLRIEIHDELSDDALRQLVCA